MQLVPLALAATAAALVIVPELSEPDEAMFRALPIFEGPSSQPILADSHVVSVPCVQCDGADRSLSLNFSVVDDKRLLLNGRELYPQAAASTDREREAKAAAATATATMAREQRNLGYSLAVVPEAVGKGSKLQLLNVELRVIEVGDRFVDGVPAINVRLFKAPFSEDIIIADVAVATSKVSGCNSLACRAREGMGDMLTALKGLRPLRGCHGRGGRRVHHGKNHDAMLLPETQMQAQRGSSRNRPQSPPSHEWRRILTHIAAQILLPVLMGITAGVGVALLAMAVCSLFLRLAACVRGRRTETGDVASSAAGSTSEESFASEKDRLMEVAELPPQYTDEDCKN
ncbi:hypothetical protein E4U43_001932 [Claviceps pusilla]|uniref:DUF7728 domain-containing protein n=1 Tax=Claviceps pusilla TaxID=123648 RepID=A0A9P7N6Y8_9HYPO|nr:hypothetical protein E4U43_001932 [Claviceps pusilla]